MKCKMARKLMNEYLDENLKDSKLAAFKQHIEECRECREELQQLEKMNKILKSEKIQQIELPDKFHEQLMQKVNHINNDNYNDMSNKIISLFKYRLAIPIFACLLIFIVYNGNSNNVNNEMIKNKELAVPRTYNVEEFDNESSNNITPRLARSAIFLEQGEIVDIFTKAIIKINAEFENIDLNNNKLEIIITDNCLNDEKVIEDFKYRINNKIANDNIIYKLNNPPDSNSTNSISAEDESTESIMKVQLKQPSIVSNDEVNLIVNINDDKTSENITFIFQKEDNIWDIERIK